MENVSVLGLGNWGTALANHLANAGNQVLGWSVQQEVVAKINSTHRNPYYQNDVELSSNLKATEDLDEALQNKILIMVVPSSALHEVVPRLKVSSESLIVSAIKGLEMEKKVTPLTFMREALNPTPRLAVLSGPSFARDVVRGMPCGVVAASDDEAIAQKVAELFSSSGLRVYTSSDPLGVEMGGILKNVIAIAVGVCDGLKFGDSARAGLVTRGLAEMTRLAVAMGADPVTLTGLSGLGDLVLTATCDTSRNRTVGLRLGQGQPLPVIIENLGSVAEGVRTTPLVLAIAEENGVEMPITSEVAKLIRGEIKPQDMANNLLSRPLKAEN